MEPSLLPGEAIDEVQEAVEASRALPANLAGADRAGVNSAQMHWRSCCLELAE